MKLRLLFSCEFLENSYFAQRKNILYEIKFFGYWICEQTWQTKKTYFVRKCRKSTKMLRKTKKYTIKRCGKVMKTYKILIQT